MIINEDYFDELKISDDDIQEDVDDYSEEDFFPDDIAVFMNEMRDRYKFYLRVTTNPFNEKDDTAELSRLSRLLRNLFSIYDIECSHVFVIRGENPDISDYDNPEYI